MTIIVHTVSGAPRAWRVLLGLAFKGLPYEIRYLEASKGEHKSPDFLKLNPRGTVPVMQDGDITVRDSIGCLAWLDAAYPEKPLFGHTLTETAEIWQTTLECCDYLRAAGNGLLFSILVENKPLPADDTEERNALDTSARAMHAEFSFLESLLGERDFLAGNGPTAADAVAFPEVRLVERAVDKKPHIMGALGFNETDNHYPRLAAWKARINALPGYSKTIPRHW